MPKFSISYQLSLESIILHRAAALLHKHHLHHAVVAARNIGGRHLLSNAKTTTWITIVTNLAEIGVLGWILFRVHRQICLVIRIISEICRWISLVLFWRAAVFGNIGSVLLIAQVIWYIPDIIEVVIASAKITVIEKLFAHLWLSIMNSDYVQLQLIEAYLIVKLKKTFRSDYITYFHLA